MSGTYEQISFWSPSIKVKEVISASRIEDFKLEGKTLNALGTRLNYSSLEKEVTDGTFILKMVGNEFIEFA